MVEDDGYRAWFKAERSRSVRPVTPEDFAALRELNVVVDETDESITLSPPCPTASHRPEKIACEYTVTFRCPAGEETMAFCGPCTADRRAGTFVCSPRVRPSDGCPDGYEPGVDWPCHSTVVRVRTLHPRGIRKT